MDKKVKRMSSYAVITCEGCIILSKLNRGPNVGLWNLVGGEIGHGEKPVDALRREIKEESGLTILDPIRLLTVLSEKFHYKTPDNTEINLHLIGVIYHIELKQKVSCKLDGDGDSSDGCFWFEIRDLDKERIVSFVSESLQMIKVEQA
jgi:ADP-ribose pyrophosphatase YjhB (NUDIX family)